MPHMSEAAPSQRIARATQGPVESDAPSAPGVAWPTPRRGVVVADGHSAGQVFGAGLRNQRREVPFGALRASSSAQACHIFPPFPRPHPRPIVRLTFVHRQGSACVTCERARKPIGKPTAPRFSRKHNIAAIHGAILDGEQSWISKTLRGP